MMTFTAENTQGFSAAELVTINAALDELLVDVPEDQRPEIEKSLSDRLNNEWYEGITVVELVKAARQSGTIR
jgi:hypothetical protein